MDRIDDRTALDGPPAASAGTRKAPARRKVAAGTVRGLTAPQKAAQKAERWAHRYTVSAVVLSSGLNAYGSAQHSSHTGLALVAGAVIGAVLPVLVWQLSRATAWAYRAGRRRPAYCMAAVACCLLALSVAHVAAALVALCGLGGWMAALYAVGIDAGLVSSEATAILVSAP